MQKLETANEVERALQGLMPVSLSEHSQREIGAMLDELSGSEARDGEKNIEKYQKPWSRRLAVMGAAAALITCGFVLFSGSESSGMKLDQVLPVATSLIADDAQGATELVSEMDRVEEVSDEGLFVDSGGSAVRKVRVRVVEESRIKDKETGIIVMLTEPREEMYMLPVSHF